MARCVLLAAIGLGGCAFGSPDAPSDCDGGCASAADGPNADARQLIDARIDAAVTTPIVDATVYDAPPCIAGDQNQVDPASGHCYSYFGPARSWATVRANCEALGPTTHMVTFESAAENAFIHAFVNQDPIWTGANDMAVEMTWMWVTGTSLSATYANWENGEPNQSGNEDCAYFKSSGEWADVECSNTYSSVCERE